MSIAHKEKTRREIGFTTSWDAKEWTGRRWAMNWAWAEAPRSVFMTLGTTDCFVGNFLCCCFSVASRKLSARFFVSCALFCVGCRACYCAWFAASHSPSLLLHLIYLCVCVCVCRMMERKCCRHWTIRDVPEAGHSAHCVVVVVVLAVTRLATTPLDTHDRAIETIIINISKESKW